MKNNIVPGFKRWGPYLQSCQWGFNMGKLKLSQISYPVAHCENRLYYITLPDIMPAGDLQAYCKCSCLMQDFSCESMMLNLAPGGHTVIGIWINYLYFNFRGPRLYLMWVISGSDLGQISPIIWTPYKQMNALKWHVVRSLVCQYFVLIE